MCSACSRLRAKDVWCSCRTAFFAVARDILAKVVPSRASRMGTSSSIPHSVSLLCEDCSLWLEISLQGSRAWLGISKRVRPPVHRDAGSGLWGRSIAPTRVPAEVGVEVAALAGDTVSIRAVCLL